MGTKGRSARGAPRLALATLLAYNEILRLKAGSLPVKSSTFLTPSEQSITVCSYEEFCRRTGVSFGEISLGGRLLDGYCVTGLAGSRALILYNAEQYSQRLRFTMLHEVGHIVLSHTRNAQREEAEANAFASQFLMPGAIITELGRRGYAADSGLFSRIFDVSAAAARVKMGQMAQKAYEPTHLDDSIISRFTPYLDQYFPHKRRPVSHADYFYGGRENYRAYRAAEDNMLFP
ncbi:MAG: ImmA/IrrE family metallo-endopeptidase [Defluviitaleaceae bacterium]|nr:ImmA/IrrE family metallo-endopeptidase [Defluviitaleaceae bacterium]